MSERTVVAAHDLECSYSLGSQRIPALRGVSLDVRAGECVGIAGSSGSGKTTLLHILGLLLEPGSGEVVLDGVNAKSMSRRERDIYRRHRIGFIFQDFHLLPSLTVWENCSYFLLRHRIGRTERKSRVHDALGRTGIDHLADRRPHALSRGERQRVAIARVLARSPAILYADEPTASLDHDNGAGIMDLLLQLSAEGVAVVMASHDPAVLERCHRMIHLRDGRMQGGGQSGA